MDHLARSDNKRLRAFRSACHWRVVLKPSSTLHRNRGQPNRETSRWNPAPDFQVADSQPSYETYRHSESVAWQLESQEPEQPAKENAALLPARCWPAGTPQWI